MENSKRTYTINKSTLTLIFGDIIESDTEVIVSCDDTYLSMGGGVSAAIKRAGGNLVELDVAKKTPASLGNVVVSSAGSLPAKYIFHIITLDFVKKTNDIKKLITQSISKCFNLIKVMELNSISFPVIGTGHAQNNYQETAKYISDAMYDELMQCEQSINVKLYLYEGREQRSNFDFIKFFEVLSSKTTQITTPNIIKQKEPVLKKILSKTTEEIQINRVNCLRNFISDLENQRYLLEDKIIKHMINNDGNEDIEQINKKLQENKTIRLKYLSELKQIPDSFDFPQKTIKENNKIKSVFVSSTYADLKDYRLAAKDQITKRDMLFRGMENFGAESNKLPASLIVEEVNKADIYLGIFGVRYGYIDDATGLSMTELEYNAALSSQKTILLYVIDSSAPVKVSDIEFSVEGKVKLDALKNKILKNHTVYLFKDVNDFKRQVFEDLGKHK